MAKQINFNPADFELVREIVLQFPDASDSLSHYDTPSIKIKKNLLCRLHEGGEWLAMRTDLLLKAILESGYRAITAKK